MVKTLGIPEWTLTTWCYISAISDRSGTPSDSNKHFCEVMGPRWFVYDLDYEKSSWKFALVPSAL